MREAELWRGMPGGAVSCFLCQRRCYILEGKDGFCRVRRNAGGKLYSLNWGKCAGYNVDPIEKKPFYHFMPGTWAFSFAAPGCNFDCDHCQNYDIAQPVKIVGLDMPPERMASMAQENGAEGMAYTYTEPTIFYEYARDTAILARKAGLYNVWVSNGYMTPEAIDGMVGFLDAIKIDLKGFSDRFYKEVCGGAHLEPVLKSIKTIRGRKHLEIVNLIIPGWNDSEDEIRAMCNWLRGVGADIPIHFTGYYPANRMKNPPTPVEKLQRAREIALEEGLLFAYTGNRHGDEGENTFCPKCSFKVIERWGMEMVANRLVEGNRCPQCKERLPIISDWRRKES